MDTSTQIREILRLVDTIKHLDIETRYLDADYEI